MASPPDESRNGLPECGSKAQLLSAAHSRGYQKLQSCHIPQVLCRKIRRVQANSPTKHESILSSMPFKNPYNAMTSPTVGPQQLPILRFHVPNEATVLPTSKTPRGDIGNCLGPSSRWTGYHLERLALKTFNFQKQVETKLRWGSA